MFFENNQIIIILLSGKKLMIYNAALPEVITFPFDEAVVKDIELLNRDELQRQISECIATNKLKPGPTVILLSPSITFEKNIPKNLPTPQQEDEIDAFINTVPFEDVFYKTYPADKEIKIVATNKDLCNGVRYAFEKELFSVETLTPLFILGNNLENSFTKETLKRLATNMSQLKQNSIEVQKKDIIDMEEPAAPTEIPHSTARLLIVFMVMLFAGMFYMAFVIATRPRLVRRATTPPTPTPAAKEGKTPVTPIASRSATLTLAPTTNKKNVQVTVLNASGLAGQADSLRTILVKAGFSNVKTGNADTTTSTKTIIVFSSKLASDARNGITDAVKTRYPEISVIEANDTATDVTITIGKSNTQ